MLFGIGCGAYDAGAWRMNSEHEVRHFIMRLSTVYEIGLFENSRRIFTALSRNTSKRNVRRRKTAGIS